MRISVIIPTFNRSASLARALDSVLSQKGVDEDFCLQIIVVDDGSTDNTQSFVKSSYPQVTYLRQANQGVSSARNVGLKKADGEWIALLDSDDEWLPHKLSTQLRELANTQYQVCHTQEVWVRDGVRVNQLKKHQKHRGWIFQHCLPLCAMSPSSILIRDKVVDEVGCFDEELPACEDYDYWLRLTAQHPVAYVEQPSIIKYGGHADQLSRRYWGMDRFRVRALENALKLTLKEGDRAAALTMLNKKLQILLNGARKHQNYGLIKSCEQKLERYAGNGNVA